MNTVTRRAAQRPNPWELLNRAKKVHALLATISLGRTAEDDRRLANALLIWDQADRNRWAAHHGIEEPSEQCWKDLCDAVRARRVAS